MRAMLAPGEEVIRTASAMLFRPLLKDINDNAGRLWTAFSMAVNKLLMISKQQRTNNAEFAKVIDDKKKSEEDKKVSDKIQTKIDERNFGFADGGLMNLGGREMDMRGGGFIPIGKKERADDVPARLSKNEFVMTADAVRAAGGGSVNKGAKRMYDLMNNLEARV